MKRVDFKAVLEAMKNTEVVRPNSATAGTLSGHAAGEPFEKSVYAHLKESYPGNIFKQYEYLNDLYSKHPKVISLADRYALLDSPTVLFLLSRGDKATAEWTPENIFEEKQNDTADIVFHDAGYYDLIDVKTRNISKKAQAPNIISAYKLAKACGHMIDNGEFENLDIDYIEMDWVEEGDKLKCTDAHHGSLFRSEPDKLYINWAAAMQIQFHVCDLDQSWKGTREDWARGYIETFVKSAQHRCRRMQEMYVEPFLKYIKS
ncbi:MAG: HincII family type II restriction endonuclease [Bacteroidaceae bacterium]|nr:HincII family type II restriction endonuclease [Bacteroidaceae bacterium]